MGVANRYLMIYGNSAWDMIRHDRLAMERQAGKLNSTYREAEHFLYSLLYLHPEQGWMRTAILTEGYWVVKAISNLVLRGHSPYRGSPVSWDQLLAGLYGNYCATFGCSGLIGR